MAPRRGPCAPLTQRFRERCVKRPEGSPRLSGVAARRQDGMLKNAETYEIMRPELIGRTRADASGLVMGKHSGRAALAKRLRDLGFTLPDDQLQDVNQPPSPPHPSGPSISPCAAAVNARFQGFLCEVPDAGARPAALPRRCGLFRGLFGSYVLRQFACQPSGCWSASGDCGHSLPRISAARRAPV